MYIVVDPSLVDRVLDNGIAVYGDTHGIHLVYNWSHVMRLIATGLCLMIFMIRVPPSTWVK